MLIPCPYCGPRDLAEFFVGGEAETRPDVVGAPDDAANAAAFADAVYLRDNPAGPHRERWLHAAGCQSWLTIERNTMTHDILRVELARAGEPSA